jgi:hypothetical protein
MGKVSKMNKTKKEVEGCASKSRKSKGGGKKRCPNCLKKKSRNRGCSTCGKPPDGGSKKYKKKKRQCGGKSRRNRRSRSKKSRKSQRGGSSSLAPQSFNNMWNSMTGTLGNAFNVYNGQSQTTGPHFAKSIP